MDQESGQKAFFFKWLFSMILFKYWFYLKKLSLYSNWVWPDDGLILVVIKLYSVNLQKYDNAFLVQE